MSDVRSDDTAQPESSGAANLSEAGREFDDELHDAEAEADDQFET